MGYNEHTLSEASTSSEIPSPLRTQITPATRKKRAIFFGVSGSLLLLMIIAFRDVMTPFVLAIVLAYVLAPLVARIEKISFGKKNLPRWAAVLIVYVSMIASLVFLGMVIVPRLIVEGQRFAADAPRIVESIKTEWTPRLDAWMHNVEAYTGAKNDEPAHDAAAPHSTSSQSIRVSPTPGGGYEVFLPQRGIEVTKDGNGYRVRPVADPNVQKKDAAAAITEAISRTVQSGEAQAVTILQTVQTIVRGIITGIFTFSMTLMISAYLLITRENIFEFFRSMVIFERRRYFDDLLRRIDRGLGGVVRGQLLICMVNGVLSGIGFYIADLPYWPILTVIATVFSIIPIFGAFLSSVPAVLLGLHHSFGIAVFVLLWIIGIHQIEANFLNPKILGDSAKVHPVLVIFALLAGEHFFGFFGALLAVPTLSIAQSLFLHFRMLALGMPASSTSIPPIAE